MSKRPAIALPPRPAPAPATAAEFVAAGQSSLIPSEPKVPTKRLTIDVEVDLHTAFKIAAMKAGRDMKDIMADLIRAYLDGKR